MVDAVARQLIKSLPGSIEFDELVSYGREGLLFAARRFDPSHEVPFRAYAHYRVRGAMIDGVRKSSELPRRTYEKLRLLSAADQYGEHAAADVLSSAPPPGEAAKDAQRALDDHLARMATAMAMGMVGKAGVGEEGEPTNVAVAESPEIALETAQLRALLREAVEQLPEQEAELVRRHYFEGERFDNVAKDLGLSKSWASRLHTRAVGRLTKRLKQKV